MPAVFINYRTGDEEASATLIELELSRWFGSLEVFRASTEAGPTALSPCPTSAFRRFDGAGHRLDEGKGSAVPLPATARRERDVPEAGSDIASLAAARTAALVAAGRNGLRVTELTSMAMHEAAAALFDRVWYPDRTISPATLRALEHTGNYVAGAFLDDRLVGASVGFFAVDRSLHSHITGIAPEHQGLGVGYAIKQHQRAWALDRGVDTITWTFDPLVRRNAYFNLHKLGACLTAYLPDFYGAMTDGINAGDLSDRLSVCWRLTSPRAVAAAGGRVQEEDLAALRAAGRHVRLDRLDGERPEPRQPDEPPWLVAVPEDIERLRRTDAVLARAWRLGVREALLDGLAQGLSITAISRDGWYVMRAHT